MEEKEKGMLDLVIGLYNLIATVLDGAYDLFKKQIPTAIFMIFGTIFNVRPDIYMNVTAFLLVMGIWHTFSGFRYTSSLIVRTRRYYDDDEE